jgi:hypothetical protein
MGFNLTGNPSIPTTLTTIEPGSLPVLTRDSTAPSQPVTDVGLGSGVVVWVGQGVAVGVAVLVGVGVIVGVAVEVGGRSVGVGKKNNCERVAVVLGVGLGVRSLGPNSTRVSILALSSTSKETFRPNGLIIYLPGVRAVNSTVLGPSSLGFWPV